MPGYRIKWILIIIMIVAISSLLFILFGYHLFSKNKDSILKMVPKEADIAIDQLHHVAMRDGKKEWVIDAKSAQLINKKNLTLLENVSVTFFHEQGFKIYLEAEKGQFFVNSNNLILNNNIILKYNDYKLKTKQISYNAKDKCIFSETPISFIGESISAFAKKLFIDIKTKTITFEDSVDVIFQNK